MYHKFLGIDIGKAEFYVALHGDKQVKVYSNNSEGFEKFRTEYKLEPKLSFVVLETTGGYEMQLLRFLQEQLFAVHRANTLKIKNFVRSYGKLGKSDNIDALNLAHYGFERHANLELFVENSSYELTQLVGRRHDIKKMLVQEKNRLQAPEHKKLSSSYKNLIEAFETEIQAINAQINELLKSDTGLTEKKEVLKTIAGIGEITATDLLVMLPELGKLDRKKIASLAGVAPHPNESGKKVGYRFTRGGRQHVKPILFMAAMAASRSHSGLGETYKRLTDSGKKKMVAITALMRKIVVIANARLRDYEKELTEAKNDMLNEEEAGIKTA